MHLSKSAGYAIHALSCIEKVGCQPRFIRDIAKCTGLKQPYLAKIINQLAHDGLVLAKRGYRGGITLARPPETISLLQIVKATEGEAWLGFCLFGLDVCPAQHACPAHEPWTRMRKQIETLLDKTTLADVIQAARTRKAALAEGPATRKGSGRKGRNPTVLCPACGGSVVE